MTYRRIAWDRTSFSVPEKWELTSFRWPEPGQMVIELEDDFSVCMHGEWQWSEDSRVMKAFLSRLEKRDADLVQRADRKQVVGHTPRQWAAAIYHFNKTVPSKDKSKVEVERNQIYHAAYSADGFAASFQIQSTKDCPLTVEEIGRTFMESFRLHHEDMVPWELFDISISMPKAFALKDAQFGIGSKLLTFEREKRTLNLWILSCADVILKDADSLEKWCCGFLNSQGRIRSLVFKPTTTGGIVGKRRFPMLISHLRDIAAWCFRWKVKAIHQKEENRLLIWAYNYRKEADLAWLPEWLSPPRLIHSAPGLARCQR